MATKSEFSLLGLAHKFCLAAEAQGYTPEFLNDLAEKPKLLAGMYDVQRGLSEIRRIEHVFDRSKTPRFPFLGAQIEEHNGAGTSCLEKKADGLYLDGKKIILQIVQSQKNGTIVGIMIREKLSKKPVLDVTILDYLLDHPELIPEDWKRDEDGRTRYIYFWGTVYRRLDDYLYVRCMFWSSGTWQAHYRWIANDWLANYPAAMSAS